MEIGSFIELQFPKGKEYYSGDNTARLNSGRAAIYHAVRLFGCKTVWLPYYQCDTVRAFLKAKSIEIKYYNIDADFEPLNVCQKADEAVLIVNYFGIFSEGRMKNVARRYKNVIVDNCQAFFSKPLDDCNCVYSARKFIGVSDGSYVVGKDALRFVAEYEQDYSSDTAVFLMQRIEYGCEGKAYESRSVNEKRLDECSVKKMSKLTRTILDGTDYDYIIKKRTENFKTACLLFNGINKINPEIYFDETAVPMVYPLVVEDDGLLPHLQKNKHFQGHWWSYITRELPQDTFESWLSRYIVPITIDQRYSEKELEFIRSVVG